MQTEHYMANMGRTEPSHRFAHSEPVDELSDSDRPPGGAGPAAARPDTSASNAGPL